MMFSRAGRMSSGKNVFPGGQLKILPPRQVFRLEQGVQHRGQEKHQEVGVFLVEFTFFQLEIGQEYGQERAQSGILAECRVHHALRLFLPVEIILTISAKVNLKLIFRSGFAILFNHTWMNY